MYTKQNKIMRGFIFLGFILSFFTIGCENKESSNNEVQAQEASTQKTSKAEKFFTDKDGRFQINFPGTPQKTSQTIPTDVGSVEIVLFMFEKSVTEVFMVAYSDYPTAAVEQASVEKMLQGAKGGALSSAELNKIEEEKSIQLDGHSGLFLKAKSDKNNFHAVYEMYLVKNRLYQIIMIRDGGYPRQEDIDGYIKSFSLIKE